MKDRNMRVKTASKTLIGYRSIDKERVEELARQQNSGIIPPHMLNNAKVLRHLWMIFDYKGRKNGVPESKIEFHIPFFYEDYLQLNYNLTEMRKADLSRLSIRGSKSLPGGWWVLPNYDFQNNDAGLDIQKEM